MLQTKALHCPVVTSQEQSYFLNQLGKDSTDAKSEYLTETLCIQ